MSDAALSTILDHVSDDINKTPIQERPFSPSLGAQARVTQNGSAPRPNTQPLADEIIRLGEDAAKAQEAMGIAAVKDAEAFKEWCDKNAVIIRDEAKKQAGIMQALATRMHQQRSEKFSDIVPEA